MIFFPNDSRDVLKSKKATAAHTFKRKKSIAHFEQLRPPSQAALRGSTFLKKFTRPMKKATQFYFLEDPESTAVLNLVPSDFTDPGTHGGGCPEVKIYWAV